MPLVSNQYRAPIPIVRFLDTNGDGTGTKTAIGDYSAVPAVFYIAPPADEIYVINELLFHIVDAGAFTAMGYGALATLTNGIQVLAKRGAVTTLDILDGMTLKSNEEYGHISTDLQLVPFNGGAEGMMVVSFRADAFGTDLRLNGSLGDTLGVYLSDNFTGLLDHHFVVHGYR